MAMASEILRFKCRQYWPIAESTTGITTRIITRIITEDTAGSIDRSRAESSFQSFPLKCKTHPKMRE